MRNIKYKSGKPQRKMKKMAYIDNYEKYLNEIGSDIEKCVSTDRRVVFGYTSDADVLLTYNEQEINAALEKYLKSEPAARADEVIDSMETFARIISYYMLNGLGGEADITDVKVVEYLLEHFEHVYSLGGTGAQGSAALASAGMPLIGHISDKSDIVCNLMDYPGLDVIRDGKRVPIKEIQEGEPVYHIVFAYTKGDKFRIGDTEYEVPVANRLILDYDTIHKDIIVEEEFKSYIEQHAGQLISYNLSGFNAIVDAELTKRRMQELGPHYRKVKENNPDCIFYFESAHYLSLDVKTLVYQEISKYVDIMGMNEEELVAHTEEQNVSIDKEDLKDVIRGMDIIIEKYRVNGIIMHTKDYSMYYGEELRGINLEKALTLGNLLAGTRARVGHYGNQEEFRESLGCVLSPVGLRFAEELAQVKLCRTACLVPSRYMEKPVCTIGLGDTFVAGVQFAFVK